MSDDFDWLLNGVIWFQSAVLIYMSITVTRCSRYITRLWNTLTTANEIIDKQKRMLMVRSVVSSDMQPVDIDRLSPEMRGIMRQALAELLQQLKQKEH